MEDNQVRSESKEVVRMDLLDTDINHGVRQVLSRALTLVPKMLLSGPT